MPNLQSSGHLSLGSTLLISVISIEPLERAGERKRLDCFSGGLLETVRAKALWSR
jgi:hypothetical protein